MVERQYDLYGLLLVRPSADTPSTVGLGASLEPQRCPSITTVSWAYSIGLWASEEVTPHSYPLRHLPR